MGHQMLLTELAEMYLEEQAQHDFAAFADFFLDDTPEKVSETVRGNEPPELEWASTYETPGMEFGEWQSAPLSFDNTFEDPFISIPFQFGKDILIQPSGHFSFKLDDSEAPYSIFLTRSDRSESTNQTGQRSPASKLPVNGHIEDSPVIIKPLEKAQPTAERNEAKCIVPSLISLLRHTTKKGRNRSKSKAKSTRRRKAHT
ncbi:hypothetical protein BXZ70DRAFT_1010059 [Cristinia sonorae]|uniref:Uncharacterized protein n=1 Tax=Cristinia sonorae TaxID=1940300 RepID=A0A8K0UL86_9AGAR|nr:hypothetical protein BXZ70DRAFT_1010059 [Cristinia sonorae]